MMKSEDTLDWYPAQLPPVKIILGEAVLFIGKQGRPINARTLLEYLQVMQLRQKNGMIKLLCRLRLMFSETISALTANVNARFQSVSVLNDFNRMIFPIISQWDFVTGQKDAIQCNPIFSVAA